jgi:hypothetical protein
MRIWITIVGVLFGVAVGGLLIGLLAGLIWVTATDDDPNFAAADSPSSTSTERTGSPTTSAQTAASPSPTIATLPATATPEAFAPITISGEGERNEPLPQLTSGILVFTIEYEGDRRFTAAFDRGAEAPRSQLASVTGPWEGSRVLFLDEGQTPSLAVTGTGPWSITIDRPMPTEDNLLTIPFDQTGSGSRAIYYVDVPQGMRTMSATHTGDGPFAVFIMNEVGRMRSRLIDAEGDFEGSAEFRSRFFPTSRLLIDVRASGDWTIRIE